MVSGPDDVVRAIDRLSEDIRSGAGESLATIRAGAPLERVTTPSLEALRLYTEAASTLYERNDVPRAQELLRQALRQDSTFAMAWRLLGVASAFDPTLRASALAQAFRYRDHLDVIERNLVEAYYYSSVVIDHPRAIPAYERVLRVDPEEPRALNNLAGLYREARNDGRAAEELLRRAIRTPGRATPHYSLLFHILLDQDRPADAAALLDEWATALPETYAGASPLRRSELAFVEGDLEAAEGPARAVAEDVGRPALARATALTHLARYAYWAGRLDQGRDLFLRAEALSGQAGESFDWEVHRDAAYQEALVGDGAWAAAHLREALEGAFAALPGAGNHYAAAAMRAALSGDADATERIVEAWREHKPDGGKGPTEVARMALASLHAAAARGQTEDIPETMDLLLLEMGCSRACYPFFQATLHDRLGEPAPAAELYERVLRPGDAGWGLDTGERLHAMMRLGPLYEELGDTARAVEAYRRMIDLWADADALGMLYVEGYRAQIAALGG